MAFLSIEKIRKSYGGRPALSEASLEVEAGEIHALLGENGAGKTTLMNILYGLLAADGGSMRLSGQSYAPTSPNEAMRAGVGMVHQHFMLVPTLTVAENVLLGDGAIRRYPDASLLEKMRNRAVELGFHLHFESRVDDLSVGESQRVEIFKLLWKGGKLLILDEPTAVLAPAEVEELFKLLRRLRDEGRSILFISHKLEEIRALCDRVTVLRRGATVGTFKVEEKDNFELTRMMVGGEIETPTKPERKRVALSLDEFRVECEGVGGGKLRGDWTLRIPPGAIAAVAGIEGAGQRDLAETVLGLRSPANVRVYEGKETLPSSVRERIERGVGFISEDRQRTGLVLDFTLSENFALKDISEPPWSRRGWLDLRTSRRRAQELVNDFDIHPRDPDRQTAALSGGNQQKVVVARELSKQRRLLVATNPTRGLDVGARSSVHRAMHQAAAAGAAILLISTELEEVLELADSIHVLHAGELVSLPREEWSKEALGLAMIGAAKELLAG
jgi:simple sugar transport system ATP-binding protein